MAGMSSIETPAQAAAPAAEPPAWEVMDTLGLLAAVFLVFIVADILSDGRLISRRLRGPRPPAPEVPGD